MKSETSYQWLIIRTLIMALGIRLSLPKSAVVSLFNLGHISAVSIIYNITVLAFCFHLVFRRFHRLNYIILFALQITYGIIHYSAIGPFFPHISLLIVFGFFAEQQSDADRRQTAIFFMSAMYLSAGFFKLHSSFLSGFEFSRYGDFFYFVYQNPYQLNFFAQTGFFKVLPALSIISEMALGLFVLFYPRITSHISLVFILILIVLHPAVIHIYFCLLPFAFLLDENILEKFQKGPFAKLLSNLFFWFTLIFSTQWLAAMNRTLEIFLVVLFLILLQTYWFFIQPKLDPYFKKTSVFSSLKMGCTYMFFLIFTLVGLRATGLIHAPLGYSMFSALSYRGPVYTLRSDSEALCKQIRNLFYINLTSAAKFYPFGLREKNFCFLDFPTHSGMKLIKEKICQKKIDARWDYLEKKSTTWSQQNCLEKDVW